MRVLIVDDEEPLRKLLQHWVEAEGATVIEAGTAEDGLALAQVGGAPAVALCDIRLGAGKDGLWLAEQLHAGFPETVVLMTTGVMEFNAAVNSLQNGVLDYLVKPFTRERLTDAVQRAFLMHKSRAAVADMQRELDERRAQIAEALGDLEMNASASLEAMLAMLRVRDAHSYDHAHRVAQLSVNLAMALRISEPQLSDVERAALLHNLGRLALPDSILVRKERSLSEEERAKVRSYPLHGQAMLKNVPFLAAANEIAVAAHERYDGSGFPRGLKGEDIPIGARVIAVADVWDELVSGIGDSPVAPAHALEIMTVERLPQFDPLVLGALTMLQLSNPQGDHPQKLLDAQG
jgi:response regulator RpfG family c-di-GMP phosphodiesterase